MDNNQDNQQPQAKIKLSAEVTETLPSTMFRVRLLEGERKGEEVIVKLAGKMRMHYIRVIEGDRVVVEIDPHPASKVAGRLIFRERS